MIKLFKYENFELRYQVFGSGEKHLFAFHGFGKSSDDFKVFSSSLGASYSIYSFDLFLHGKSIYNSKNKILKISDLINLFELFIKENNISKFSVLGYSLGGKTALSLSQHLPDKIDRIFLFAPDGIKFQYWYWFASHTFVGKATYQYIIHHPKIFHRTIAFLVKIGLLNERMEKFLLIHTENLEKRQLVYDVWMAFRDIHPSIKKIKKNIHSFKIPTRLYFGRYDQVIPPKVGEKFIKGIEDHCQLYILDTGHNLISEKVNDFLIKNP